jgi:carboxyvinyl-carboxyphosphonate phosphorylmutase
MDWNARRQRMRTVFEGDRCVFPGSVYDAISARVAEDLGFEAGMFAGSIGSFTVLGAPDIIVLTLSEFAQQAYRICRAGNLPLIVDADHGYGNALNVKRTVEELETAGVATLTIEDTVLPQAFGAKAATLIPVAEGVGKMKAALAGRQDPKLVILGRTSAVTITGVEDAIARGKSYLDAGVDGLMFVGVKSREQLDAIAQAVDAPIMLGGIPESMQDLDYLSACGVRVSLQGHQPFMAAVKAMHDTLKALREGTPPSKLAGVASGELMQQVTRESQYGAWIEEFLGG